MNQAVATGVAAPAPYALTAAHFAVGLMFLLLGSAGLVWVAPELAAGRFLMPRVVAVTHVFTLGWITTSIMGALYQLFPVVLGTGVRWTELGYASLLLYAPGLLLFVAAMAAGAPVLMLFGATALVAGLLVFLANATATLARATRRDVTWWALAGAFLFLLVTIVLGSSLAGNLRWAYLGANRLTAVGVHMHVALGGWVLLVVIGVARRLLPMFLLSHGADQRPGTAAAILIALGAGVLTVLHHAAGGAVAWVSAALLAVGVLAFLVQAALYVRHSHRPRMDPGLRLAATGVSFLFVALVLGTAALLADFGSPRVNAAYGVAIVLGAFTLFVAGHYYKILPFLVWNHRFAAHVGPGRRVPRVVDLFSSRVANTAVVLLGGGAGGLTAAVVTGHAVAARAAAMTFAAGAVVEVWQMITLHRERPES